MNDITVVGMGYVGMCAALGLSNDGGKVHCVGSVDPSGRADDTRSTALFPASIALLKSLDVWDLVVNACRPLAGIRIVDESGSLLRAPEITFRAAEAGLDALAMNVPNHTLHHALATRILDRIPVERRHSHMLKDVKLAPRGVELRLSNDQSITSQVVIAADGRGSTLRSAAGISTRKWSYNQVAIACSFSHTEPHNDISTEFHRAAGPLTTVPGSSTEELQTSHLVWIERPDIAKDMMSQTDEAFRQLLETALQGVLGGITNIGKRGAFPIHGQTANAYAAQGVFLVGEAAHVIPPIGAQGMNLGFRDVEGVRAALSYEETITGSVAPIQDFYNKHRQNDVFLRPPPWIF